MYTCLQRRLFIQTTHNKIAFQICTLVFSSVSGLLNSRKGLTLRNNHCASRLHCNQCTIATTATTATNAPLQPLQLMQPMHCTEVETNAVGHFSLLRLPSFQLYPLTDGQMGGWETGFGHAGSQKIKEAVQKSTLPHSLSHTYSHSGRSKEASGPRGARVV